MIITPKNAIEIVLTRKTSTVKFQPYDTSLQKWLFWSALVTLIIGVVGGVVINFWKKTWVVEIGLITLLLSVVFATLYQIAIVLPDFLKLKNVEKEISRLFVSEFDDDIDLIFELSRNYQLFHISYARDSFSLMANQLRSRISLLVGAIDKVGAIPLAVTAYLSGMKAIKEGLVNFGGIEWILAALILLYLLAMRMSAAAQWMDRISVIYKEAYDLKSTGKTEGNVL
jgi:uncharacterized membrane protein